MKKVFAMILELVMVLGLCACGAPAAPAPAAEAPAAEAPASSGSELAGTYDITVWVADAIVDLTKQQIADFNASNEDGIVFNATVEAVGEGDAATQMITDVEAGGDIFCFAQDQFARLVQAGALAKLGTQASHSIANQGSVILGHVTDSVISSEVIIEENAVCTKCVVMEGAHIQRGAKVHNAIIAPYTIIEPREEINLDSDEVVLISRRVK